MPSNLVRSTLDELIKHGTVLRGTFLGIQLQALTTQIAEQLNAPDTRGVLVTRVDTRSRAYAAGLRPGDIIVTFNGAAIDGAPQFLRMLDDAEIGSTATLAVLRDGRSVTVRVPVEQAQPTRRRTR